MVRILQFLIDFCAELFTRYGFRFADSSSERGAGGVAWVLLESVDTQLYFSLERGELLLEVRSLRDSRRRNWYSLDLIRRLLTGEPVASGVLTPANAEFLRHRLADVLQLFAEERLGYSLARLDALRRERASRL